MPGIADLIAARTSPSSAAEPAPDEPELGAPEPAEGEPKKAAPAKAEAEELGVEAEGEGPAKQVPLRHLTEQRAKRRAAEQERDAARAEAAAAKERTKVFDEL